MSDGGSIQFEVDVADASSVRWAAVADDTPVAGWLTWRGAEVRFRPLADGTTEVRWEVEFARKIDPAWYFAPWERLGVRLALEHLIDASMSTPR